MMGTVEARSIFTWKIRKTKRKAAQQEEISVIIRKMIRAQCSKNEGVKR